MQANRVEIARQALRRRAAEDAEPKPEAVDLAHGREDPVADHRPTLPELPPLDDLLAGVRAGRAAVAADANRPVGLDSSTGAPERVETTPPLIAVDDPYVAWLEAAVAVDEPVATDDPVEAEVDEHEGIASGVDSERSFGPEPEVDVTPEPEVDVTPEVEVEPEVESEVEPVPVAHVSADREPVTLVIDADSFARCFATAIAPVLRERPVGGIVTVEQPKRSFWSDSWHPDVLLAVLAMVILVVVLVAFVT